MLLKPQDYVKEILLFTTVLSLTALFKATIEITSVCNHLHDEISASLELCHKNRKEGILLETQFINSLFKMPVVSMEIDTLSNGRQIPVLFYHTNGEHLRLPNLYSVTENKYRHVLINCLDGLLTVSADYGYEGMAVFKHKNCTDKSSFMYEQLINTLIVVVDN